MKHIISFCLILLFSLTSCTTKTKCDLILDKLNELTESKNFSSDKLIKMKDGSYHISIYEDDINNGKSNSGVLFELQDYLSHDLKMFCTADTMKNVDISNFSIDYISDDYIVNTSLSFRNIGIKNHAIWRNFCDITIKKR